MKIESNKKVERTGNKYIYCKYYVKCIMFSPAKYICLHGGGESCRKWIQ